MSGVLGRSTGADPNWFHPHITPVDAVVSSALPLTPSVVKGDKQVRTESPVLDHLAAFAVVLFVGAIVGSYMVIAHR